MDSANPNQGLSKSAKGVVNTPTPSLAQGGKVVHIKPLPALNGIISNRAVTELESRSVGIYSLKRINSDCSGCARNYILFSYKLGKTRYNIESYRITKPDKGREVLTAGNIIISKGMFNEARKFELIDLPKNIVDSINEHINRFNKEYNDKVGLEINYKLQKQKSDKSIFFEGLDT